MGTKTSDRENPPEPQKSSAEPQKSSAEPQNGSAEPQNGSAEPQKGSATPPGPDPKAAREREAETVSKPGGFKNDPDDPTNPNEAIERSRKALRERSSGRGGR